MSLRVAVAVSASALPPQQHGGPTPPPSANLIKLEDGTGTIMLEDGSGSIKLET